MEQLIDNFINGNLNDARKQAKRFKLIAIRTRLEDYGLSFKKAQLIAEYLKTGEGYQAACDAE
ncbi:MAG: hypothetical protein WCP55_16000 [Lentisphaerota bacterium]